ncbi:MAG: hypothetical protein LBH29_05030 [Elusimicrobiota bacterium]|nr:hypothetical protein [Elusimicrobiota bacterium]
MLTFLILSGPTKEYIDPVRFISNDSSGKMGTALYEEAVKKGHRVIFISGQSRFLPKNAKIHQAISASDMFKLLKKFFGKADIVISTAAIADFRPAAFSAEKIKKKDSLVLKLVKNPDLLSFCSAHKKRGQVIAGFALETENLLKNAQAKLEKKNLDLIVANTAKSLNADAGAAVIIKKDGQKIVLKKTSKNKIAQRIINETISIFRTSTLD